MTDSTEQKTEKPTPHHLRQARKRGEVARSQEVIGALVLLTLAALFAFGSGYFWRHLQALLQAPFEVLARGDVVPQLPWLFTVLLREFGLLALPPIALVLAMALAGAYWQVGGLLSFAPIQPKLAHLNPAQGIRRIFSLRSLIELAKTLLKLIAIGAVLFALVYAWLGEAFKFAYLAPAGIGVTSARTLIQILVYAGLSYAVLSSIDYAHQYYEFMKRQRMSKRELRREAKELEGDPYMRAMRRSLAREVAWEDAAELTRGSSVVIDGNSVAVALHYSAAAGALPTIAVKGSGVLAHKIRQAAQEAGIALHHDAVLARRLHDSTGQGNTVPAELFDDVAQALVLAGRTR